MRKENGNCGSVREKLTAEDEDDGTSGARNETRKARRLSKSFAPW